MLQVLGEVSEVPSSFRRIGGVDSFMQTARFPILGKTVMPAVLVMWPYFLMTGHELGTTTTLFFFAVVGFLTASTLWLRLRSRYFPNSSLWIAPLGVMVLGLASHVLALQRRPLVWELPIATAFAFSMLALLFVQY